MITYLIISAVALLAIGVWVGWQVGAQQGYNRGWRESADLGRRVRERAIEQAQTTRATDARMLARFHDDLAEAERTVAP